MNLSTGLINGDVTEVSVGILWCTHTHNMFDLSVQRNTMLPVIVGRARDNKLAPHEFMGGSFTISNLGMFGITNFSAIINPPQACILAVGGTQQKTVLRDGKLATVEHMTITLSADNRIVDEETASEFLRVLARNIENPGVMMIVK